MFSLPGRSTSRCDYSDPIRDQYLIYTDKVLDAFSESTCRQACTQERDFNCRSYSFLSEVSRDETSFALILAVLGLMLIELGYVTELFLQRRYM